MFASKSWFQIAWVSLFTFLISGLPFMDVKKSWPKICDNTQDCVSHGQTVTTTSESSFCQHCCGYFTYFVFKPHHNVTRLLSLACFTNEVAEALMIK